MELEKDIKEETNPALRELLVEYAKIFRQERAKQPFDATRGLEISVILDYPENVEYFIERGGNVNAKCCDTHSMLGWAASLHFFDIVKILVESGADVNAQAHSDGDSPLMLAIENTDYEKTTSIRRRRGGGAEWTTEKLKSEREKTIKFLFEKGADLNAQDKDGWTATHLVVRQGDVETLRWLIENGADFRKGSTRGKGWISITPLKVAAMDQDVACIDILIAAGSDPNEDADKGGDHTPLFFSLSESLREDEPADFAAAQKLIDAGAKTDLPDLLSYFVSEDYFEIVKFLLQNKANPNTALTDTTMNGEEFTVYPLYLAVKNGNAEIVKMLIDAGADVNAKTSLGETALGVAVAKNNEAMVKLLLLTAGAKPAGMIAMVEIPNKGFSIGKYEVTQAEYESVMGKNPSEFKGENRPVENVSWNDAMEFCKKLTERERILGRLPAGYEYTLPTSEQWVYACRAGTTTKFYTGDTEQDLARAGWYDENSGNQTHPVGQKEPNAFGLYDMHGNVWEWCLDKKGSIRVNRGGSYCRSGGLGFRVALVPVVQ